MIERNVYYQTQIVNISWLKPHFQTYATILLPLYVNAICKCI